ncbi:MAG TPA: hypothetical protein VK935_08360 [Actinomycetospora sp.]|nr:hypothetical protein [Actinomycetospora sp.]
MQALQVISTVAQTLSPLLYAAFIVVIWFQLRAARESVREARVRPRASASSSRTPSRAPTA